MGVLLGCVDRDCMVDPCTLAELEPVLGILLVTRTLRKYGPNCDIRYPSDEPI